MIYYVKHCTKIDLITEVQPESGPRSKSFVILPSAVLDILDTNLIFETYIIHHILSVGPAPTGHLSLR